MLLEKEDNKIYLNILKHTAIYNSKENSVIIPNEIDGGHKLEILLFGDILTDINILASIDIFRISSWQKTIKEHLKRFIFLNSVKESEELKEERNKFNQIDVNEIENNNDYPPFFKKLIKYYAKIENIEGTKIQINTKYRYTREINNFVDSIFPLNPD